MKMDIRNCIADLLSVHDCVIIPGFGGFIGNYSPARIDPVYHSFQPPCKKLLFNINLKQNDGLLANAVADFLGTSYHDACTLIDLFAGECRQALKAGMPVIIPDVGKLSSGREGNIQFEQDKNANLLPDSFGLVPFISPPVSRSSSMLSHEQLADATAMTRNRTRFILPRVLKWAAILALPVAIAVLVGMLRYNPFPAGTTSDANILSSVFSRFSSAGLVEKKDAPQKVVIATVKPHVVVLPAASAPATPVPSAPAPEVPALHSDDSFAIIVGAFRLKENAGNYVAALKRKGIDASVFDRSRTGLYRVAIGTSALRDKAEEMLANAKSGDFRTAWLLAK